jgi:tRNA-Thr(GGU) m(6)t(6)A37 methyltransferase TsaA
VSGDWTLTPVGYVQSSLTSPTEAPKQGAEGAPDAWFVYLPETAEGFADVAVGDELVLLTWLHRARRDVLRVRPRDDPRNPETGVFSTRSADRPNPIGLHPVTVLAVEPGRLRVGPLEAVDGTPVLDVKPLLRGLGG